MRAAYACISVASFSRAARVVVSSASASACCKRKALTRAGSAMVSRADSACRWRVVPHWLPAVDTCQQIFFTNAGRRLKYQDSASDAVRVRAMHPDFSMPASYEAR